MVKVRGRIRVPRPAAKTTAFTDVHQKELKGLSNKDDQASEVEKFFKCSIENRFNKEVKENSTN